MSDPSKFQFTNAAVPPAYDHYYRPRIFEPWAELLLDEANVRPGACVLDVACGPGTVARMAARRVGAGGRVTAADIAEPMLAIARAKPPVEGGAPIEYLVSPAAPLAVADGFFDFVLCQQGLQFFPDRRAALREMLRALRGGGRLAVSVWTELHGSPLFQALYEAIGETISDEIAELYKAPFTLPQAALAAELQAAGFGEIRVRTTSLPLVWEGGIKQAADSIAASPVSPMIFALPQEKRDAFVAAARRNVARLRENQAGELHTHMTSNVATATKPS